MKVKRCNIFQRINCIKWPKYFNFRKIIQYRKYILFTKSKNLDEMWIFVVTILGIVLEKRIFWFIISGGIVIGVITVEGIPPTSPEITLNTLSAQYVAIDIHPFDFKFRRWLVFIIYMYILSRGLFCILSNLRDMLHVVHYAFRNFEI